MNLTPPTSRLGVLGGTFDPPHIGHLLLAAFAQHALGLEQVLFVPAGDPPHKSTTRVSQQHRLAMLELALRDHPSWAVSRADLDRPGPHYTVDLLALLAADHPQHTRYFLMGGDSFRDLPTWSRPHELFTHARLAVMQRPTADIQPEMHEALLPGLAAATTFIDAPLIGISSTDIVRWHRAGAPIEPLLPRGVYDYVETNGLYR